MEMSILYALQKIHTPMLDKAMVFISQLGNSGMIWIIIGLLMLCYKNYRKCGVAVLFALIFCLIFGNGLIKNLVARPRPCWIDTSVMLLIPTPTDFSFPSGHTFSSFAAAICIFFYHKKEGSLALALAILIAFSRLYLFVHFPTDILGGIALGTIAACAGIYFSMQLSKHKPVI